VKRIVWTDPAKSDVRSLSKPIATQIFSALHRFAQSGVGNVKALQGREELRLRIGDCRLFFISQMPTPSRFAASVIAARPIGEIV
jgi:mRNA interferase RelE/StbE